MKEKQTFKKGTICVLCGIDKKEAKKYNFTACSSWGAGYPKHLWNDRDFQVYVNIVMSNPFK